MIDKRTNHSAALAPPPEPSGQWGKYLLLWERLTRTTYGDGASRKTDSLTFFFEEGTWKACLSDRDQEFVAFITGGDPVACLGSLERRLADNSLEWRQSGRGKKR